MAREDASQNLELQRLGPARGWIAALSVLLAAGAWGCSGSAESSESGQSSGATRTSTELVCGLVRADLVRRIVGDASIDSTPMGSSEGGPRPTQCQIANADTNQIVMQLAIGPVDPAVWGPKLEREAAKSKYGDLAKRYTGDPGTGYGLTYESGIYAQGASVHVIRDDVVIRSTIYNWLDTDPQERLALAEDVARDMAKNFSSYSED